MSCICKQVTRKMNLETYENKNHSYNARLIQVNRKITLALSPLFSRGNADDREHCESDVSTNSTDRQHSTIDVTQNGL